MSVIRSYFISNLSFQIECEDKQLGNKVIDTIEKYFYINRNSSIHNKHTISLKFTIDNTSAKIPRSVKEILPSSPTRVFRDDGFCYLKRENSVFKLDLSNDRGIGFLDYSFWNLPPKAQQEFLMLSIFWFLHKHGIYALHSNCLEKNGIGILLVGSSGSGKSTTAISLIRQGWNYISDDVTLLRRNSHSLIEAIALPGRFSIDPHLASNYPELNNLIQNASLDGNKNKKFIDIKSLYPDRFLPRCIPEKIIMIFPRVVSKSKSQLIPIDKTQVLTHLIENSPGIMVDKEKAIKQIEVLKHLMNQATLCQMLSGQDLYKEPGRISEVLSGVIEKAS